MGRGSRAIGFAVYLDLLEGLDCNGEEFDVDTVLLCDAKASPALIAERVRELTESGESVSVQKELPEGLRYRRLCTL